MTPVSMTFDRYKAMIGDEVGVSGWIVVDQPRIDGFAKFTLDHQFIHVDPQRAQYSPFGGTIAHGFLLLSLLSRMSFDALPSLEGAQMGINYGFNNIRFLTPVPSGKRVRGRFVLGDIAEKNTRSLLCTYDVSIEIEDVGKPALVAQWLTLTLMN